VLDLSRTSGDPEELLRRVSSHTVAHKLHVFAWRVLRSRRNGKGWPGRLRPRLQQVGGADSGRDRGSCWRSDGQGVSNGTPERPAGQLAGARDRLSDLVGTFLVASDADRGEVLAQVQEEVRELRRTLETADRPASVALVSGLAKLLSASRGTRPDRLGLLGHPFRGSRPPGADGLSAANCRRRAFALPGSRCVRPESKREVHSALAGPELALDAAAAEAEALERLRPGVDLVVRVGDVFTDSDSAAQLALALQREGLPSIVIASSPSRSSASNSGSAPARRWLPNPLPLAKSWLKHLPSP